MVQYQREDCLLSQIKVKDYLVSTDLIYLLFYALFFLTFFPPPLFVNLLRNTLQKINTIIPFSNERKTIEMFRNDIR